MDVHLLSGPATDYVVLVEAVVDRSERVTMQQQGNQLALDQHRQGRLLDSHVGRYVAEQLRAGGFSLREEGERREASLLFCDLRGFTSFAEQQPPELVFRTLNQLLQAMVQPILDRGGWLDKIAGDAVYAAFGLIPPPSPTAALPSPVQALLAGQEILHNLRRVNAERQRDGLLPLGAGIGISTGGVAVGILGTQERRQFSVIGHHVNLAARLQAQAQAGEIVIDAPTHAAIGALGDSFVLRPLRLKGLAELLPAYSLLSDS
jgi:class 3 adenylate cyclase